MSASKKRATSKRSVAPRYSTPDALADATRVAARAEIRELFARARADRGGDAIGTDGDVDAMIAAVDTAANDAARRAAGDAARRVGTLARSVLGTLEADRFVEPAVLAAARLLAGIPNRARSRASHRSLIAATFAAKPRRGSGWWSTTPTARDLALLSIAAGGLPSLARAITVAEVIGRERRAFETMLGRR